MRFLPFLLVCSSLLLAACKPATEQSITDDSKVTTDLEQTEMNNQTSDNPFYKASDLPFEFPPFDKINNEHFAPAFAKGMADHLAEIDEIANNSQAPTLQNTLEAMEASGRILNRVASVFYALTSANTNERIEAIRTDIAPKMSAHSDAILLNSALFSRIKQLKQSDRQGFSDEANRLIDETYKDFIAAGAELSDEDKETLKSLNAQLASLQTSFSQNVLNEVNDKAVVVDTLDELAGLSESQVAAAAKAAKDRDLDGKYVLPLLNTSQQPSMSQLENRGLRERILKVSLERGSSGGEFDNREVLSKVFKLRAQRAQLLGYENHAAYSLDKQTAKTTAAVNQRLATLAPAAVANAVKESEDLQAMIDAEGGDFKLAAWDWTYYTEKLRAARYNFDESQLKPYLEMNNVLVNGVFYAAEQLYGLSFKQRKDLPTYHDDVVVWEVLEADGSTLAFFLQDFYARESKRGGAWMNAYVSQSTLLGNKPVVANHLNVTKPSGEQPALLTWDEVITMFHEFGHALHGMFSNVRYPSFSGTSVPRDFVEYPSQVNEMWAAWPQVLSNYAVHHETGEAISKELLEKILATSKFNQGYETSEYLAASLLDQAWHQLSPEQVPDADGLVEFEENALVEAGVKLDVVPPRYRSTYFSHIIGGYSAGYYSYIWSEVLDADSVEWFKEQGGLSRKNGDHFRDTLLSKGGSQDALSMFKAFRGAEPNIQPLLDRRGLNAK